MKATALVIAAVTALTLATSPLAQAKKSKDSDRDGTANSIEVALGTNPRAYTPPKVVANRVLSFNQNTGKLKVYISRRRQVSAVVDDETEIYCSNPKYFIEDVEDSSTAEEEEELYSTMQHRKGLGGTTPAASKGTDSPNTSTPPSQVPGEYTGVPPSDGQPKAPSKPGASTPPAYPTEDNGDSSDIPEVNFSDDDGDNSTNLCSLEILKKGTKLSTIKISSLQKRIYFDEIDLKG